MLYVVDTHALIWFLTGDSRLGANARAILSNPGPGNRLAVPTIVLAEAWDLARKFRVPISFRRVMSGVRASGALIYPLNVSVLSRFPNGLPDIHDTIIVGTAMSLGGRFHGVSIITRDVQIRSLGIVTCIWQGRDMNVRE